MALTHMKRWIFIFFTARLMVSGFEEYIIVPTAWIYIRSFGQTQVFLALVLSVYNIAAIACSPVLGLLSDKFRRHRTIIVFCHLLRLCGNAIYSIPVSEYCPLIGRFLCGVSAAGDGVLLGEVARTTDQKQRARVFVFLDGIYTLGSSLGPAFATTLEFRIDILGWKIDEGNSPGFVMTLVWVIIVGITFFLPSSFGSNEDLEEEALAESQADMFLGGESFAEGKFTEEKFSQSIQTGVCGGRGEGENAVDDRTELEKPLASDCQTDSVSEEKDMFEEISSNDTGNGLRESEQMRKNGSCEHDAFLAMDKTNFSSQEEDWLGKIPLRKKSHLVCLFNLMFTTWFFTSVTTFYTPLLGMELLRLPSLHVKLLFVNSSLLLILLYLVLFIAAEYFQERTLLKFSVCLQIIPIIVLTVLALYWNNTPFYLSYLLIVYVSLGMPYFSYTLACSLLSKISAADEISFYQGLSVTILHCGAVSGRVFPSFIFTKVSLTSFSIGLAVMWIVGFLWLCMVYERLDTNSSGS